MLLVIEMGDTRRPQDYAKIHKAGCKHLVDPEPIGSPTNIQEVAAAVYHATGWEDYEVLDARTAMEPCTSGYNKG